MRVRYENWVGGLTGDWLISRQRFFGVPIPVWYPLDADGEPRLRARRSCRPRTPLPVDPSSRRAARLHRGPARRARRLRRRPRHHGHLGDVVADPADRRRLGDRRRPVRAASSRWTCARRARTSSAPGCSRRCVRCAPRARRAAVDARRASRGLILDPDRKKMSKSKGNVVTPDRPARASTARTRCATGRRAAASAPTPRSTADPARSRSAAAWRSRCSTPRSSCSRSASTAVARRVATSPTRSTAPCSPSSPTSSTTATAAFEAYDHARALEVHRAVLLDLLRRLPRAGQGRAPTPSDGDAQAAPAPRCASRSTCCCACSRRCCRSPPRRSGRWWHDGLGAPRRLAGRRSPRPPPAGDAGVLAAVGAALAAVRKVKSEAKVSMRTEVAAVTLAVPGRSARRCRGRPRRRPLGRPRHGHARPRRGRRETVVASRRRAGPPDPTA